MTKLYGYFVFGHLLIIDQFPRVKGDKHSITVCEMAKNNKDKTVELPCQWEMPGFVWLYLHG